MSTHYYLKPERSTLHGVFSRDLPPALTVDSGDVVHIQTLDVSWGLENHTSTMAPRRKFEPRDRETDQGPALCGPIAITDAQPGQVLEIRIEAITTANWGWTWAGGRGFFNTDLNRELQVNALPDEVLLWELDPVAKTGRNQFGQVVALDPFPGTIGMPLDESGHQSGWFPRRTGGNMDCPALTVGSVLYLPIAVSGGLLSVGDGHAAQGHGEIGGTAIECPFEDISLRLILRRDLTLQSPFIVTKNSLIALGFAEQLDTAIHDAVNAMLDYLQTKTRMNRAMLLGMLSAVADVRVTQLVNRVQGAHVVLPDVERLFGFRPMENWH